MSDPSVLSQLWETGGFFFWRVAWGLVNGVRECPADAVAASTGRRCPYCVEGIQPEAVRCKHCGEMLAAS